MGNMTKVILVGTQHKYQAPAVVVDTVSVEQFRELIHSLYSKHKAKALAEEMSQQLLQDKYGVQESVMQKLSAELGIKHQLSDPSREQRIQLGIGECHESIRNDGFIADWDEDRIKAEIRRSDDLRECYWLEKLCELDKWPLVFVCGACHVDTFSALLRKHGIRVEVAYIDWKPN